MMIRSEREPGREAEGGLGLCARARKMNRIGSLLAPFPAHSFYRPRKQLWKPRGRRQQGGGQREARRLHDELRDGTALLPGPAAGPHSQMTLF